MPSHPPLSTINISKLKRVTLRAAEAKEEYEKAMKRFNYNQLIKSSPN